MTDEVIHNLGPVLELVLASAHDPVKHLSDLRGEEMKSRYYGGTAYQSYIEIPGTLETFLSEKTGDGIADHYYWYCLVNEEAPANLHGNIKEQYQALCKELKRIYPNATVEYEYDNEHYFKMTLDENVSILVTHFYSEGYKDLLVLNVLAAYSLF